MVAIDSDLREMIKMGKDVKILTVGVFGKGKFLSEIFSDAIGQFEYSNSRSSTSVQFSV